MTTISDIVRDQHGNRVSGATVKIRNGDGEIIDTQTTNDQGEWTSILPDAAYSLVIQKGKSFISRTLLVCAAVVNAPVNVVPPVASGGPLIGDTVSCTTGTWSGPGTFAYSYQWRRNGANISLATSSTYVLVTADDGAAIDCVVTATTTYGATPQDSNNIGAGSIPAFTVSPVASGTPAVGQTLSCTAGTTTGTATIISTYQWRRDGVDIGGATSSTYVVVTADAGTDLDCMVTATNSFGYDTQDSNDISIPVAMITGYRLWLKADAITGLSDGDPVATWPDSSGNAFDAVSNSGYQPIFKTNRLNGMPSVLFNGFNHQMLVSGIIFQTGYQHTIFTVLPNAQGRTYTNSGILWDTDGGTWGRRTLQNNTGWPGFPGYHTFLTRNSDFFDGTFTQGENVLIAARFDAANSFMRFNGDTGRQANLTCDTNTDASGTTFKLGTQFNIPEGSTDNKFYSGDMAEILIYNSALSDADVASVEAYLKAKYGIS